MHQIVSKIKNIFQVKTAFVVSETETRYRIELHMNDYEDSPITFDRLCQLSELLKTKDINFTSKIANEGCETCGNGRKIQYEVYVKFADNCNAFNEDRIKDKEMAIAMTGFLNPVILTKQEQRARVRALK